MQQAIDKFHRLTGYDVSLFLVKVDLFYSAHHPNVLAYFNGSTSEMNKESFNALEFLDKQSGQITQLYRVHKNSFNRFDDWQLLEVLETVGTKLKTAKNAAKYLRSVKSFDGYTDKVEVNYNTKQFQTLENVSKEVVADEDFQNDWAQIALHNQLREEDFNILKDDNTIKIHLNNIKGIFLNSVLGGLYGETVYGLDIKRKLTYKDNDLETLSYKQTAKQSLDILVHLSKNDVPEYPDAGKEKMVGITKGSLSFRVPTLIRQMNEVFSTDDTFTGFRIININNTEDVFEIEFEVDTVYNQVFNSTLSIK